MSNKFRFLLLFVIILNSACVTSNDTKGYSEANTSKLNNPADDIVFQDWRKKCQFVDGRGNVCMIYQNLTIKDSGKSLLYASFSFTGKDKKLVGSFKVPFGIFLPSGIAFKIGENKQVNFAVQTCLADGCYSSVNIDNDLLNQFKSGLEAKVGFKSIDQKQLAVKLSLKGFTSAINSLKD